MAKLDALKEKLNTLRAGITEKLDKIAFIKKLRERKNQQPKSAESSPGSSYSLGSIYREGGTGTRLQVITVYILAVAAMAATFHVGSKMLRRLKSSEQHEQLRKDYSSGLAEMSQKIVENANLISLGKFTSSAYNGEGKTSMMAVDIWIRVSDPDTADFAQKNEAVMHDRIVDALDVAYREKIAPLTDDGKNAAKSRIMEALNEVLPNGKVEDVLFENLVVQ